MNAWAQPVAQFTVTPAVCRGQQLALTNSSSGADAFEWDFCARDLEHFSTASDVVTLPGFLGGFGFKMVNDGGQWHAFTLSLTGNRLYRLDYGNNPLTIPTQVDLGNPGNALNQPQGIELIKSNGNWFGFVGFNTAGTGVVRLDFGNSLTNTPTAQNLGTFGFPTSVIWDLRVRQQGTDLILLLLDRSTDSLIRINYGNSFLNSIIPANIVVTSSIPGASTLLSFDLVQTGSTWVVLLTSFSNSTIIRLNWGSDLMQNFSTSSSFINSAVSQPIRIRLIKDSARAYALVANNDTSIGMAIVDYNDFSTTPVPLSPVLPVMFSVDGVRWQGKSIISGLGLTSTVKQFLFENVCSANPSFSTSILPAGVSYSAGGINEVSLLATNSSLQTSDGQAHIVTASSLLSPDIDFSSLNNCANNPINFSPINSSGGISGYAWNFGDTQTSTSTSPTHTYSTANTYQVNLTVTATNSCTNFAARSITVFNVPVADFSLPAAPVCTNQEYLFLNTTSTDAGSNPVWEWRVNGSLVSSQMDLVSTFTSPVGQTVQLKAILPGCSNEMIKTIASVLNGPSVDFSVNDSCVGTATAFTNETTGATTGFSWDFGDATGSSSQNPTHTYASANSYTVKLTAPNASGCQNFKTKTVQIYSIPQPDFTTALPPFSCANSLTPFHNTTPPLVDSNISGWTWQFGDSGNSTSNNQDPNFTFVQSGTFSVTLTASSNVGCSKSITKPVVISVSPTADFTFGPSCLNQTTQFTDLSTGGVQSRVWQIGSGTFSSPNPVYIFSSSGSFSTTLTVNGSNGCSSTKMIAVIVPVLPTLNFSVTNPCVGKETTFTDQTVSPQDVVTGWNWLFDGNAETGDPVTFKFVQQGTHAVKLTTTHASGCKYTLSKSVVINPSPTAAFTAFPDRGAAPLTVQFTNTSQNATSYSWSFNDKTPSISTRISPVYTYTSLGNFSAELTATNSSGCSDVMSIPIIVLVPAVDLIMTNLVIGLDPVTGKSKPLVTIKNNGNVPVATVEVELFLADKASVSETLIVNLAPGQSVSKTLSSIVSGSDYSFLCAEIISEKDVQSDNNKRCLSLAAEDYFFAPYPNPTADLLKVDWISSVNGSARILIYDVGGRRMYDWQTTSHAGLNQTVHDMSFLTAGIYFLSLETPAGRKTIRFMRE